MKKFFEGLYDLGLAVMAAFMVVAVFFGLFGLCIWVIRWAWGVLWG